ncbi:MAG TPA: hypothetical protein VLF18_20745 [Tahibacter sp.]|uniref:hypothetical protein n=1 Tax=Tahibacter sp. TaxID=2056211 RepID=UPI002B87E31C|nr:hypothetical protein [Tahibacter sp.]HSX62619.1 hypothetical protein [Tahibacter sp.]
MNLQSRSFVLALAVATAFAAPLASAASGPQPQPVVQQTWTALGGDIGFIWNVELLRDYGIAPGGASEGASTDSRGFVSVPLRDQGGLSFAVTTTNFDHFTSGRLALRGGFRLTSPVGEISLVDAVLVPRGTKSQMLDVVDASGNTLFYLDRLMYAIGEGGRSIDVQTMDLRVHADLAQRLGKPEITDWVVAQMRMSLDVVAQNGNYIEIVQGEPVWPGTIVPGVTPEARFQADVFMLSFQGQYSRCTPTWPAAGGSCDGPSATTDGYAVFTPSSTLRNNVNNGVAEATVAGDPNGTSSAMYTADIAWYRKFTGARPPYDNDQHPNLIWNIYRIDANNRIEQIGRSGVKHAFVTTNSGCSSGPGSGGSTGAILGRSCSDTYGTGNNDSSGDLGPRNEIIPATGEWGRCGSIFDPNCDLSADPNGNTSYSQRLITRESQITAGGTYYMESWYLVREDINIYNTMASRPVTFNFGSSWSLTNGTPQLLGPVINRWVSPTTANPNEKNVEIASPEGHTRVAVKVVDLGDGTWRYDYAVMNFDFARAVTQGTGKYSDDSDPAQRFRVIHNFGFDSFSVPLPAGVTTSAIEFNDGELDDTNNWTGVAENGAVTWTAPANPSPPALTPAVLNPLNWGTMFRFSFIANQAPTAGDIDLHVAQTGKPSSYTATVLAPSVPFVDEIFVHDFEPQG